MKLFTEDGILTLSFTSSDCRILASVARGNDLPEHFQAYSLGLEASAVSMDRRERDGRLNGGEPIREPELTTLTFSDLLLLIERGLSDYPQWREVYRRLSYYLSQDQEDAETWDWCGNDTQESAAA